MREGTRTALTRPSARIRLRNKGEPLYASSSSTARPLSAQVAERRRPTWLKRVLLGSLAVITILPLAAMLYQVIATGIDLRNYPSPGGLVDVGGYRLYLHCVGENVDERPTVILETGLGGGATSADWAWVQPEIAKVTRACAYDRAGLGWSDRSPQPRDASHIAVELHTLLENSHTAGPYVLVGWSYGGLYVREYENEYPRDVVGMVLLDSSSPQQCDSTPAWQAQCASTSRTFAAGPVLARLGVVRVIGLLQPATGLPGPESKERLASLSATKDWEALNAEWLASPATNKEVLNSRSLGSVPLLVVTATNHGASSDLEQLWQIWQSGYTALSTNGAQQVVRGATHESLVLSATGSRVSVEAILQVVQAAGTSQRLKP